MQYKRTVSHFVLLFSKRMNAFVRVMLTIIASQLKGRILACKSGTLEQRCFEVVLVFMASYDKVAQ